MRISLTIQGKFDQGFDEFEKRVTALEANPDLLEKLLRQAIRDTILVAWRKRALDNFEESLRMELANGQQRPIVDAKRAAKARKALEAAGDALALEELNGKVTKATKKRLEKAAEDYIDAHESPRSPSSLSTGSFRILALKVLHLMIDASKVQTGTTKTAVMAGIGNLAALEQIHTPSATPLITDHDTSSSYQILWRQLEFGTGIYGQRGRGWWFGPRAGRGLQLRGSKGWNAIFDKQGIAYQADAIRLERVFAELLTQALQR